MQRALDFYRKGHVGPVSPSKTFLAAEIPDLVSKLGKIVLLMPDWPSKPPNEFNRGPLRFRSDREYLFLGDSGKATRAVATWLVEPCAQHIVFLSRPTDSGFDVDRLKVELASMGCTTACITGDVTREEDIVSAIRSVDLPFAGVLHLTSTSKVGCSLFPSTRSAHEINGLTNSISLIGDQRIEWMSLE